MSVMIERVAEAIWQSESDRAGIGRRKVSWADIGTTQQGRYIVLACAAIEAMREPTPEMLDEGPPEPYLDAAVWSKMIGAALK